MSYRGIVDVTVSVVLLWIVINASVTRAAPRPVNISNTWILPDPAFPVFYRYFRDRISWYEADAVCQFHHGNLVTVDSSSQFDAVRSYLKELNIVQNVWIGLTKTNENTEFIWSNSKSLSGDGYWREVPPVVSTPLCTATDPSGDFRWHALGCGGPEVASFVCELPVPPWAIGEEGCVLRSLPALTIIYLPEQTAVELTADCGPEGTRRIACKGKANQPEMIRQLTCPQEKKSPTSTPYTTHAVKSAATKPWIWTSNTIDTGDYGAPTRHRRETEDMLSTADVAITKELSTSHPPHEIITDSPVKRSQPLQALSTTKPEIKSQIKTTPISPKQTTLYTSPQTILTTIINGGVKKLTTQNPEDTTNPSQPITDVENVSINQGQLLSLIENGTVYDIIEVNDSVSDLTANPKDKTKIIDETTTKVTLTSNSLLKKEIAQKLENEHKTSTDNIFTTVSYYKEAPPSKTSQAPITSIHRQPTIETQHRNIDVTPQNIDVKQQNTDVKQQNTDVNQQNTDSNQKTTENLQKVDMNHKKAEMNQKKSDENQENTQIDQISDVNQQVTEGNQQITERNQQNTERNPQNTERNQQITERNHQITERNQQNTERNQQITERNQQITEHNQQIIENQQKEEITEHDQQSTEHNQQISESNQKKQELSPQTTETNQKPENIHQRAENQKKTATNQEQIKPERSESNQSETTETNRQKDLTIGEQDSKTFIKAIESAGNSLIKLNRTSRKELPEFNVTTSDISTEIKNELEDIKNTTDDDKSHHRVVEITLMHDDKKKEGTKLYVTTKKHDKLKMRKTEKTKLKNPYLSNDKKITDDTRSSPKKAPIEVHEMVNITTESNVKLIDTNIFELNSNKSKNNQSERIPIKLKVTTPEPTEDGEYEEQEAKDETTTKIDDESSGTTPAPLYRPNRSRQLTRPQRRSFYPYFFSRVLG